MNNTPSPKHNSSCYTRGPLDRPWPNIDSTIKQMTQNFLEAANKYFQSSNVVEVTIETAKEFALTANNGTVNSQTQLSSVTSDVQSLNIKRADPRVTHEWFTLKLNSSKPQQPGTFVIEHQTIPYADVLGLQVDETKIILDTNQRPQVFYKKKDESGRQNSTWSQCCDGSVMSESGDKIRLNIEFHQPNKIVKDLIQSDIYLQVAANEGIRETYNQKSQEIMEPEAFFPVARDPAAVRAAQLAVLELLKQPEGSDVTWLISMFGGIHHKFKESLRLMLQLVSSRRKNN